jgi:hypothetical protein
MKTRKIKLTLFVNGLNAGSEEVDFGKVKEADLPARVASKYRAVFGAEAKVEFDQASGAVFIDTDPNPESM